MSGVAVFIIEDSGLFCSHIYASTPLLVCWCCLQVVKAITAGMFMNAAQYDRTEYDPRKANDAGSNVYRLLRHIQPRESCT